MSPTERHNFLIRESKLLAEVGSRTPAHTHVASIVLASLTKAMSGYKPNDLKTALETVLDELPALMVGQPNNKITSGLNQIVVNLVIMLSIFIVCGCRLIVKGGDPVPKRRPGAPGKRYKSMVEAKMGSKSARKCGLCGMKGHTARSNKCAVRIAMGTQVDVLRVPDALLGKPISDEHRSQPKLIPKGELNGFSYEEVDKTNLTVYGRFNHGQTIFDADVYSSDDIRKWAKGSHHYTFVK
jgi:hypothetical protein